MEKEFIPYEQALELKKLGFDEPCIAGINVNSVELKMVNYNPELYLPTPLYQQAFRWFREKHDIFPLIETNIKNLVDKKWFFSIGNVKGTWELVTSHETYEDAELACLKKLIEIVKNK